MKIHQSMWIHWSFFPKTWTKGHWPLHDLWPHVCWGHMCDSTQGSLYLSPMTIHQCMWIQWSILQITTYIHTHTTYILHIHTTYRMNDHIVAYWTQFRRDKNRNPPIFLVYSFWSPIACTSLLGCPRFVHTAAVTQRRLENPLGSKSRGTKTANYHIFIIKLVAKHLNSVQVRPTVPEWRPHRLLDTRACHWGMRKLQVKKCFKTFASRIWGSEYAQLCLRVRGCVWYRGIPFANTYKLRCAYSVLSMERDHTIS